MQGMRSMSRGIGPLLALACLAVAGCSGMLTDLGVGMPAELEQKGVVAPAEILEIWDTGWTINDNPVIGMKVRVRPADRPAFEATIEKTAISRIAIPQFQPGLAIRVRFDPENPAVVAVDSGGPGVAPPSSGNPYRDRFESATNLGASFLPPPDSPLIYLGTGDSGADLQALYENDYALLGGAGVENAPDPEQALDQGRRIGAALIVVYGRFESPPGRELEVLPFRRRPAGSAASAPALPAGAAPLAPVSGLGPNGQAALYWGGPGRRSSASSRVLSTPGNRPSCRGRPGSWWRAWRRGRRRTAPASWRGTCSSPSTAGRSKTCTAFPRSSPHSPVAPCAST